MVVIISLENVKYVRNICAVVKSGGVIVANWLRLTVTESPTKGNTASMPTNQSNPKALVVQPAGNPTAAISDPPANQSLT